MFYSSGFSRCCPSDHHCPVYLLDYQKRPFHYIKTLKQELGGTRAYQETNSYEMYVVNAHLNELPVKFSVCVSEGQDKLPTMYWLHKLHNRPYKARFIAVIT